MNKKYRFFAFVPLFCIGLSSCGEQEPPIPFDEKREFSTNEDVMSIGGGVRIIGNRAQMYEMSQFRIYVGVTSWFEKAYEAERFPIDKYNYEFVLRMEARAEDQGEPFFVRDVPLPDFPNAEKYRVFKPSGPGEFPQLYPRTLIEDQFAWREEDLVDENQGGSIVYRLAALNKTTKIEAHKGYFEKERYFESVKFYYWHQMNATKWVHYSQYPIFSVAPLDGLTH